MTDGVRTTQVYQEALAKSDTEASKKARVTQVYAELLVSVTAQPGKTVGVRTIVCN